MMTERKTYMTDGEREALKIKLKNEVINQRTSKGTVILRLALRQKD
jgi:hypothetical protein